MDTLELLKKLHDVIDFIKLDDNTAALKVLEKSNILEFFFSKNFPRSEKLRDIVIQLMEYLRYPEFNYTDKDAVVVTYNDIVDDIERIKRGDLILKSNEYNLPKI